MKNNQFYLMRLAFDSASDIVFAVYGCMAGKGPTCTYKHLGAVCYFLEEFCRISSTATCAVSGTPTESLQTWHQPRKRQSSSCILGSIKFVKAEYGKAKKEIMLNYNPRPIEYQKTTSSEIAHLQQNLDKLPGPVAFMHVLPLPVASRMSHLPHQMPLVPRSSQIRTQTAVMKEPQPISLDSLQNHGRAFLKMISVSQDDIDKIEAATKQQSLKPRWYQERQCRITSSNFGLFCKGVVTTAKVKGILYDENTSSSKLSNSAITWGRLHETSAFEQYEMICSSRNPIISKSGIFIYNHDGFLAASPDGIVSATSGEREGLIEIKCPYSCRNMSVHDACSQVKSFCCEVINGEIHLKKQHQYYYQIQGAMAIVGVKWCDFVVWTTKDMFVERVSFNQSFWNMCYSKLKSVYLSFILPEIIYPRIPLNLDIIQYDAFPTPNEVYSSEP